ncbi:dihydrolipoamide acetyltransferase family protein [Clostridium sp. CF012]|uniref:dihydrolipoamide acetyltransferase family protein n=1 Tax=Clostridium sp. CF012 TaxID=2843319 RepID=UPI001C0B593B|nr:dihydrolipoamide acetyltransferase family protein [Clostridium sp. CF012]MBU3145335.1 2-oxo acid dehydrogenase subunit E2 [Clostridium sp. CF012]
MFKFKFPDIGEGITEGKILKWFVNSGDSIVEGDSLFLVETDKVNAEIPSPVGGIVTSTKAKEGEIIYVGNVVVEIQTSEDDVESNDSPNETVVEESKAIDEGETAGVVGELEVSSQIIAVSHEEKVAFKDGPTMKILSTPVARKLAKDLGIDIHKIKGTGPIGRVMKEDIYLASKEMETNKAASNLSAEVPVSPTAAQPIIIPDLKFVGEVERVPLTMLRKTIAKNMVLSKSVIPHASATDEIDVSKLVAFREQSKNMAIAQGVHLTYMPFIIKAVTLALKDYPIFNASYDDKTEELVLKKYYNIGVAVDTPDGLLVPVIKDSDKKGILPIARELSLLAEKAKNKALTLDTLQNGTFTITNYGAIGATSGIPVIKHPEVAILGVGKIAKKPVVINNEIVIRDILTITICIDHRVIDGGDAGRFLGRLRAYLDDPMLLVLS